MQPLILGIHHITAISGDPQQNVNFYAGILGLRLVKKTINFDAPDVYHFYFGDALGRPGTVFTTFPFVGAMRGRKGVGELTYTAFSVGIDSLDYWESRLKRFGIPVSDRLIRFGHSLIRFEDQDGMGIELIANRDDDRAGWTYGAVPIEHSIKGFYGATLALRSKELTERLLVESMNYRLHGQEGNRFRYGIAGNPGEWVDILVDPNGQRGVQSAGTVHHLAFRTATTDTQLEMQQRLMKQGYGVTEVRDRNYFMSIYFREPGGVLFEIATDVPGFAIDEDEAQLGEALKLPDWVEGKRRQIEAALKPVTFIPENYV
jgi:glyoxalase family protein